MFPRRLTHCSLAGSHILWGSRNFFLLIGRSRSLDVMPDLDPFLALPFPVCMGQAASPSTLSHLWDRTVSPQAPDKGAGHPQAENSEILNQNEQFPL